LDSLKAVDTVPDERKISGNLHETAWHDELSGDWDIAYNLVSAAGGGLEGYRLSYLQGNESIRDWAGRIDVDQLIYTSATSVYPQSDGEWVSEEDVPGQQQLSPSGQVLHQAEGLVLGATEFRSRIVARLAGIYGPQRHLYLNRLREGAVSLPGDGNAWLNLVYLKDIVDVLMRLGDLESEADVFNVVDDQPARKQEIVDWLAAETGCAPIRFDPDQTGPRASRRTTGQGLPNRRVSNRKLKEQLGWEPGFPDYKAGYREILSAT
jgi:nucleoside-diphosphate-sugar epimerase